MAETAQERTERASPKRLRDARQEGQVPRSRELTSVALLLGGTGSLLLVGPGLAAWLGQTMKRFLAPDLRVIEGEGLTQGDVVDLLVGASQAVGPFLAIMMLLALFAPIGLGGWNFSTKALVPKWERLNPVKGVGRMFGYKSLLELAKALGKFSVVAGIAVALLWHFAGDFLALGTAPLRRAVADAATLVGGNLLLLTTPLILLALVDVPWQIWQHQHQLRMSRQEVRDESKETEGRPEVKARIRRMQQEMAQRRMMEDVPRADVVITNPSHFSVALVYDRERMAAPELVAKGSDLIALRIRTLALASEVPVVESPALARSVYYSTSLGESIPAGLYVAVAQVLAFVLQLRARAQTLDEPVALEDLPIPDDLRHD